MYEYETDANSGTFHPFATFSLMIVGYKTIDRVSLLLMRVQIATLYAAAPRSYITNYASSGMKRRFCTMHARNAVRVAVSSGGWKETSDRRRHASTFSACVCVSEHSLSLYFSARIGASTCSHRHNNRRVLWKVLCACDCSFEYKKSFVIVTLFIGRHTGYAGEEWTGGTVNAYRYNSIRQFAQRFFRLVFRGRNMMEVEEGVLGKSVG